MWQLREGHLQGLKYCKRKQNVLKWRTLSKYLANLICHNAGNFIHQGVKPSFLKSGAAAVLEEAEGNALGLGEYLSLEEEVGRTSAVLMAAKLLKQWEEEHNMVQKREVGALKVEEDRKSPLAAFEG